jgi:XTP/dITP diphosphohydrolase
MSRIVVATRNTGKIIEIREILKDFPCQVCSITEIDADFDVEEDGQTYAENALKKATAAARIAGTIAIGDDSGLEVDVLEGAPGLYSARFGGQCSQAEKNALLLQRLHGMANRSARFRCVIAVVAPDGNAKTVEGFCEGVIGTTPQGTHGFGYDPLFFLPEYGLTMAELDPSVKNAISHRARALAQLRQILPEFLT